MGQTDAHFRCRKQHFNLLGRPAICSPVARRCLGGEGQRVPLVAFSLSHGVAWLRTAGCPGCVPGLAAKGGRGTPQHGGALRAGVARRRPRGGAGGRRRAGAGPVGSRAVAVRAGCGQPTSIPIRQLIGLLRAGSWGLGLGASWAHPREPRCGWEDSNSRPHSGVSAQAARAHTNTASNAVNDVESSGGGVAPRRGPRS